MITQLPDSIIDLAKRIQNQNNYHTQYPAYCVQEKHRIYGMDPMWGQDMVYMNIDGDGVWEEVDDPEEDDLEELEEIYYMDRWNTVQTFLTEEGAKDYMETKKHRHSGELRLYVESWHNCWEMIDLYEWLKGLTIDQNVLCSRNNG